MSAITVGDYWLNTPPVFGSIDIYTESDTQKYYGLIPTVEEVSRILDEQIQYFDMSYTFRDCSEMLAAPKLPDRVKLDDNGSAYGLFAGCTKLKISPTLPKQLEGDKSLNSTFWMCGDLIQAPVIPHSAAKADSMFYKATSLRSPVSIPANITDVWGMYRNCENLTGEFIVRPSSLSYSGKMLENTVLPIIIYGDKSLCQSIAATANNENASWHPWYDPVPAVTDRGVGSRTTAEDMTRMVRNGALAVPTYAPGRMRYQQGDIVRIDEWNALVEAAQTIDPTVTYSTNYSNLNKIEAAFDSAL